MVRQAHHERQCVCQLLLRSSIKLITPHFLLRFYLVLVMALTTLGVAAEESNTHEFTFSLYAPLARSVEIVGDFNQWQSGTTLLVGPDVKGMWQVKLTLPAARNRIEYIYLLDNVHRRLDLTQPVVQDGFAGENNVFVLP